MLARDDIDAVLVASPNGAHADQVIAALDAGKHVFCQKPIALTTRGCRSHRRARRDLRRVSSSASCCAFTPPLGALRERVVARGTGRADRVSRRRLRLGASAEWFYDPSLGGGVILDTLVHFADLVQWLLGPVTRVYADGGAYRARGRESATAARTTPTVQLHHTSGAVSSLYATWTAGHGNFTCELYGVDGSAKHRSRREAGDSPVPAERRSRDARFSFPDLVWPYGYTGSSSTRRPCAWPVGMQRQPTCTRPRGVLLVLAMQESLDQVASWSSHDRRPNRRGVVGAGFWALEMHLPAFAKLPDVEVIGVAAANPRQRSCRRRLRSAASGHGRTIATCSTIPASTSSMC